jgi:hypothetical protein
MILLRLQPSSVRAELGSKVAHFWNDAEVEIKSQLADALTPLRFGGPAPAT